jgi:hypothetical protein
LAIGVEGSTSSSKGKYVEFKDSTKQKWVCVGVWVGQGVKNVLIQGKSYEEAKQDE